MDDIVYQVYKIVASAANIGVTDGHEACNHTNKVCIWCKGDPSASHDYLCDDCFLDACISKLEDLRENI